MTTIMTIMATPADNNNNKEKGWNRNTHDDGTLCPNFRPIPKGLTSAEYATAVANELYWALFGFLEREREQSLNGYRSEP